MKKTTQIIADNVDEEIKKYRALKNSAFNLSWEKCFLIHQEKEKVWKKVEFLKKLKKACIEKR